MSATAELERPSSETAGHGGRGAGHKKGGHGHGGGSHEEHEGAPEWLISFADNVMLQMGFFVILLALSMSTAKSAASASGPSGEGSDNGSGIPYDSHLEFALALREAFNNPLNLTSTASRDQQLIRYVLARYGRSGATSEGRMGNNHDVRDIQRGEVYGEGLYVNFDTGSAELSKPEREAVVGLAKQFCGVRTILNIRGHCSAAEAFGLQDRGMRLAYERAWTVANALFEEGVEWDQLRVTACGDNERVTQTTYQEAGQRTNQRVEVVQVNERAN